MIFGIAGKLESGKDTVADYLVNNYGYKKMAFADNLKHLAIEVFGVTHEQCYTTEGKFKEFDEPMILTEKHCTLIGVWLRDKNHWKFQMENLMLLDEVLKKGMSFKSPRELLQLLGTEIMRDCFDDDIHAKIVFQQIEREGLKNVAIADARFENERRIVKEHGGQLVIVDCIQTREQESTHRSETGLGDKFDYNHCIVNDKEAGLDNLYFLVDGMMEMLNGN